MNRFERLSIGRKLTLISVVTITLALIVSSAVFLVYDRLSIQEMIARRMHSQAETVAFNSATAVVFADPESAARTLSGFQSDPHIMAAGIRTTDGRLFAEYRREGQPADAAALLPRMEPGEVERFGPDELLVTRPISFEGKPLGSLVMRADLREREERFRTYAGIVFAVSLFSLGVALSIGGIAQRSISEPILELAETAHRIADHNDFSVRLKARSQDEVGTLVTAFNQMLEGLRRRDEELKTTHVELERRIKEADEANRLKDEFLATLSHELRTPLNAILGWAQILRRGGVEPAEVDRALETISRNALAQGQIIADILDMQRIAGGKLRLNLQSVELGPMVKRAIETMSPAARAKDVELQELVDADIGPVLGDEDRLQQVMWNLLSNAVKFTPPGGRVRAELRKINSHVELAVEDTGPGLDPAFIPFAFDRFRQADSSSTRRHGGLGLGLAIVRNLVELHGGSVAAGNRTVGRGALFVVRLPRMSVRPFEHPPAIDPRYPRTESNVPFPEAPGLQGVKVLVVDDEFDSRELTAAALGRCGADVVSAGSADEAIAAIRRDLPHVILSDIEMPGEDGYALIRRIRQLPPAEGGLTPAAALTAYAGTEDRMKALDAGFQIHLPKPAQLAELAAVVSSLARGRAR